MEVARRTLARNMEAATIFIVGEKADSYALGSGFIVGDGLVMTNAHVVENCDTYIIMSAVLEPVEARLLALDKRGNSGTNDFALLAFETPAGVDLPILPFNTSIERMDRVSAWGYPAMISQFDDHFTALFDEGEFTGVPPVVYTEGTVSTIVTRGKTRAILHTAAIASGNSGGPLVNSRGEVVGINTWGYAEEEEGAFVNASLTAEDVVAFLKKNKVNPLMANAVPADAPSGSPATAQPVSGKQQNNSSPAVPAPGKGLDRTESAPADSAQSNAAQSKSDDVWTTEEINAIIELANAGDSDAQVALGWFYFSGEQALVPQNLSKAIFYLTMAADKNDPAAQEILGIIYLMEKEVHQPQQALNYLRKAANAANTEPEYQSFLAQMLYWGDIFGVPRNTKEAFQWASKAAQANDADGKAFLAVLYYYDAEVELDEENALTLAQESARAGSALGQALLGWMYYEGSVVEESDEQAFLLARQSAEQDEALGQALLAALYYYECVPPPKKQSPAQAAEPWARLSAAQGNEFGRTILGTMFYYGDATETNYPLAWAYLTLATSQGMVDAAATLAELESQMTPTDLSRAHQTLTQWQYDWGL